jgi:hypothetical protein
MSGPSRSGQHSGGEGVNTDIVATINNLHGELCHSASAVIGTAIKIGELLAGHKASLPHGEWTPWVNQNLRFNADQAARYIRVFERRDELKSVSEDGFAVATLKDALNRLSKPKPVKPPVEKKPVENEKPVESKSWTAPAVSGTTEEPTDRTVSLTEAEWNSIAELLTYTYNRRYFKQNATLTNPLERDTTVAVSLLKKFGVEVPVETLTAPAPEKLEMVEVKTEAPAPAEEPATELDVTKSYRLVQEPDGQPVLNAKAQFVECKPRPDMPVATLAKIQGEVLRSAEKRLCTKCKWIEIEELQEAA